MGKLWQKDYTLDSLMEDFTVSNDYLLDQQLVIADALASIAHARALHLIGLLSDEELSNLEQALAQVITLRGENAFHDHQGK